MVKIKQWFQNLSALNRRRVIVASVLGLLLIASCVILNNTGSPTEGDALKYKKSYDAGNRKRLPTEYFAQVYLWKACAINAGILGTLLLTSPLWVGWLSQRKEKPEPKKTSARPSKRGWIILGIGLLIGLSMRLPLMERQLLFDEQDNLRRSFHGYVDIKKDGEHWIGASWQDTFFENRQGNNPPLFGVLSRAFVDTWRAITGGAKDTFNLWIMRLPSLLAGMLAIFVVWRFIHRLGMPVAAGIVVFFFALHPLAIDYSTQARGYGLVMLFASLSLLCGYRAVTEGTWKMWIAYALSQTAMMWSYPGSLYLPLAMNALLGIYFLTRWFKKGDRAGTTKFALANVLSLMLLLQVMLPVLVQAQRFLTEKFAKGEHHLEWGLMMWNGCTVGCNIPGPAWWNSALPGKRDFPKFFFEDYLGGMPLLADFALIIIPALVVTGLFLLRRENKIALLLLGAGLISPFLSVLHHKYITHLWIYHWYVIFVLPFIFIAVSIALSSIKIKHRYSPVIAASVFLVLFVIAVKTPLPALPGTIYKSRPELSEINRPGYVYKITKEGRMTREKAPK